MGESRCRNCSQRIVLVNFALGPCWVHQPPGSTFADNQHEFCHVTVAQPEHEPSEAQDTGAAG